MAPECTLQRTLLSRDSNLGVKSPSLRGATFGASSPPLESGPPHPSLRYRNVVVCYRFLSLKLSCHWLENVVTFFFGIPYPLLASIDSKSQRESTFTELRATISRHLLPPIFWWGKRVDSCRRSYRNSKASHRKGEEWGVFRYRKRVNSP